MPGSVIKPTNGELAMRLLRPDRSFPISRLGSVVALIGVLVFHPGSAAPSPGQQPTLPLAPREIATSRTRIVLSVPDAAHYAINDQPFSRPDLRAQLRMIYEQRPTKVLLGGVDAGAAYLGSA
jgi:hypothetical protein